VQQFVVVAPQVFVQVLPPTPFTGHARPALQELFAQQA